MEVEELLNLFDSYWFQSHPFYTSTPKITKNVEKEELVSCTTEALAMHEVREEKIEPQNLEMSSKLSRTPTFMVRSQSDQCLSSKDCSFNSEKSQSPKSVLLVEPKLQPILSGKECNEFKFSSEAVEGGVKYRRRKKESNSKSLSELEFEELKGFMDLGFEFSDKDKDSNLVTIIPGLRRLGRENEEMDETGVSRPHLSEAWAVLDQKMKMEGTKMNTLKSWRINTDHFGNNQMEIKHQLKLWAHTVASTVR